MARLKHASGGSEPAAEGLPASAVEETDVAPAAPPPSAPARTRSKRAFAGKVRTLTAINQGQTLIPAGEVIELNEVDARHFLAQKSVELVDE
jgi:hypothetical protein